jgi:hypothetical protein
LIIASAVGGGFAALGAAAGGSVGAGLAQAATPVAVMLTHRIFEELRMQSLQRTERVITEAALNVGVDDGTLIDELLSERRKAVLLGTALNAAARSIAEEKIAWFARCLEAGYLATDDAVVDKETFFVDAFAEVEVPHIRVLGHLAIIENSPDCMRAPTTDELSDVFASTLCP